MGLVAPRYVGSSWIGGRTRVSCIGKWILDCRATREGLVMFFLNRIPSTYWSLRTHKSGSAHLESMENSLPTTPTRLKSSLCKYPSGSHPRTWMLVWKCVCSATSIQIFLENKNQKTPIPLKVFSTRGSICSCPKGICFCSHLIEATFGSFYTIASLHLW